MLENLEQFFGAQTFIPHGHCYLWKPSLIWLNAASDGIIALAYFSIPAALIYFVRTRKDLVFKPMFVMFGIFILSCGLTHVMSIWTIWEPVYWLDGAVKAVTAAASIVTAWLVWPLLPRALALPSPAQLTQRNNELRQEIAARRQVESELRESEKKFRAAFENAAVGMVITDLDGNILDSNHALYNIVGYSPAELHTKRFFDITHPDDLPREMPLYDQLRQGHLSHYSLEKRYLRKNGTSVWGRLHRSLVRDHEGAPRSFIGIIEDIDEHKKAEEAIGRLNAELVERTVQLESTNHELEAFSYSVSHDLRAPLRSIDGFSHALLDDYRETLDVRGQHYLERVRSASRHMAQLIDDMLRLSRITRMDMQPQEVDLTALAQKIADDLTAAAPERQVDVVIAPGIIAQGDVRLLQLALENLLGNAWKFTAKRPGARIEFGAVKGEGGATVYFVRDDGAGFDMQYADKLFGAFQRLHDARDFEGTGIGLATVQRVIHRHGGRIWAEGVIEHGATFFFTLPTR